MFKNPRTNIISSSCPNQNNNQDQNHVQLVKLLNMGMVTSQVLPSPSFVGINMNKVAKISAKLNKKV